MASSLNEANLEKRLLTVTNTQESIQTLSLWCLHHKLHAKRIIEIWLKVMKKVKVSNRLALLYLANDVIQNGKRKNCAQFADAWMPVIKQVAHLVRDEKIRPQVERILTIWEDRNVYDAAFIAELHTILGKVAPANVTGANAQVAANAKILAEFKPQKLVDKIKKFKKLESEVDIKQKQFAGLKMDVCSTETLKQLKDKAHGTKFTKEFEDATNKLEELVTILQREVKERTGMIELLEQSEVFYETQKKEAKIVANAYKNFGARVKNLQTKLTETMPNLPTPVPSPSFDAPSPVDSSGDESLQKSPLKIQKNGKDVKPEKAKVEKKDETKDNIEAVDMEMSDDDCENPTTATKEVANAGDIPSPGSAPSPEGSPIGLNLSPDISAPLHSKTTTPVNAKANSSTTASTSKPNSAVTAASIFDSLVTGSKTKSNASSLDIRLSNLMQNIPNFTSSLFGGRSLDGINSVQTAPTSGTHGEEVGTPLKDEESGTGSATPLQDESREANFAMQNQSQPKEGGATPTIGDILQKLVSTGSVHGLASQSSSNSSTPNWNSRQQSPQPWLNQPTPPQAPKTQQAAAFGTFTQPSGQSYGEPAESLYDVYDPEQFPSSLNGDDAELGRPQTNPLRLPVGGQIYRRNSNIVELTPSPTGTPNFDSSNDSASNHNLITLVRNSNSVEDGNPSVPDKQAPPEQPSFGAPPRSRNIFPAGARYPSGQNPGARSVVNNNLLNVLGRLNNNGDSEGFPREADNPSGTNLRTIVPLGSQGGVDMDVADIALPQGDGQMYSKIETLDSRRETMDMTMMGEPWNANVGSGQGLYTRRNEAPTSPGWQQMMTQAGPPPIRRDAAPFGIRFGFQRRGNGNVIPRGPMGWNPLGPPPNKRPLLAPTVRPPRPPRWTHNPPPY